MQLAGLLERRSTSARLSCHRSCCWPALPSPAKSRQARLSVQLPDALLLTMQGQLEGDLSLAHLLHLNLLLLLISVLEGHHLQCAPTLPAAAHGWLQPGGLEPGCKHHVVNLQRRAAMDEAWLVLVGQRGQLSGDSVMVPCRAAVCPGCLTAATPRSSCFSNGPQASLTAVLGVLPADHPETAYKDSRQSGCREPQKDTYDNYNCRRLPAHLVRPGAQRHEEFSAGRAGLGWVSSG